MFIGIGSRRELFVDRLLIGEMAGTELKLQCPTPAETAIRADRPWEGPFNHGQSVFFHRGLHHLYYRATDAAGKSVMCLARSEDGVHWTKPNLGATDVSGNRESNAIAGEDGAPMEPSFDVFLDANPRTPDDEKIKGARYLAGDKSINPYNAHSGRKRIEMWASADGARFRRMERQPELTSSLENAFDSNNIFFWSEAEGSYVCCLRHWSGVRSVARATSKDFTHWTETVPMSFGDAPPEHLYVNQTTPYFRAPHIYVALAARFMEGRKVLTDAQIEELRLAEVGPHRYGGDCSEGVLLTTRSGAVRYERTFMEAFVRPGLGCRNWVSRANFPLCGLVQTGPGEISFYVNRDYAQTTSHVRRYRLRLDGFASVHAPYAGGELATKPLIFAGRRLEINCATGAAGHVRVEMRDANGAPVPGFSLADCTEIVGDEIARVVTWNGRDDLGALAGKPILLRFAMKDADLYSLRFR